MKTRHFLTDESLSLQDMERVLAVSQQVKKDRSLYQNRLAFKTLAMLFTKSSTRTRISFEVAAHHLGMHSIFLTKDQIQMGRGETVEDTAKVLSEYVDAIVIRTFAQREVELLAQHGRIPVINALTDLCHPCQALADVQCIRTHLGTARGKKLAFLGAASNVSQSLSMIGPMVGMDVVTVCPKDYGPDPAWMARCAELAQKYGTKVEVSDSLDAVDGVDVVYSDVWTSMGQEAETAARLKAMRPYEVNAALMRRAKPHAIFMHCLPAHRGEEVTAEVIDGPQSRVFDQAGNRLHTSKALLLYLLGALD